MVCRHCNSKDLSYKKYIGWNLKKIYLYHVGCNSCRTGYFVKRDKKNRHLFKNITWSYSKKYKQQVSESKNLNLFE